MACQSHEPHEGDGAHRAQILETLLLARREQLLRQVRRHSERADEVEEALADACVQFLRRYPGPGEVEDAFHWMLLVSKRCAWAIACRRRERSGLAPVVSLEDLDVDIAPEEVDETAQLAERHEEADQVMAAIDSLPPDDRAVLILFGLGFGYEEIARMCGWSYGKVHRRLGEGRRRVRRFLERGDSS